MPMSAPLDTAGFLTRDAKEFADFGKAWYGDRFETYEKKPKVCRIARAELATVLIQNTCVKDHLCSQRLLPSRIRRKPCRATDL